MVNEPDSKTLQKILMSLPRGLQLAEEEIDFLYGQLDILNNIDQYSPVAMAVLDSKGTIQHANKAMLHISEAGKESELIGLDLFDDDGFREIRGEMKKALDGTVCSGNREFALPGTEKISFFRYCLAPLTGPKHEINRILLLLDDRTWQKQMESQVGHSQKMEEVGRLAGGISHDFNNLLTGIIGNLEMAMMHASEKTIPFLKEAHRAAQQSAGLVKQLLTVSRRSRLGSRPEDPNAIVTEVRGLIRRAIDRRIEIHMNLAENLPPICADRTRMTTLLMNLCLNARDAICEVLYSEAVPHRSREAFFITFETHLARVDRESCEQNPEARPGLFVVLTVRDNGCGMDGRTRKRLFEPFYTTKKQGEGTGLGLSMVRHIVKQHKGWMDIHSVRGEGTTFKVYLPAVGKNKPQKSKHPSLNGLPAGNETVLVVDDEAFILKLDKRILEPLGYTVILASDGKEALHVYRNHKKKIDLVILDLSMPHLSGREILKEISTQEPRIPVIISSGYPVDDLCPASYAGIVSKPYRPKELALMVRRVLDQGR